MVKRVPILLSYLVSFFIPLVLMGTALRILLTPLYFTMEYNMPYFPKDEFGFTRADRLQWAPFAVRYLVNDADISYLGDLSFGDGTPLFNERELSHMQDVKIVVLGALRVWYVALAILILLTVTCFRQKWLPEYLNGLRRGGWWMIGLASSLGFVAGVGAFINPDIFWQFFTIFHQAFFEGDSWLFLYSDTLIRLFPIRFWQDAVLTAALITLGGGLGFALGVKPSGK